MENFRGRPSQSELDDDDVHAKGRTKREATPASDDTPAERRKRDAVAAEATEGGRPKRARGAAEEEEEERAGVAARTAEPATRARAEGTTGAEVIADIVVPNGGLVVSACSLQESARSYCGVIPRWRPPFRMSISVRTGLNRPAQRVNRPWVRVPSR